MSCLRTSRVTLVTSTLAVLIALIRPLLFVKHEQPFLDAVEIYRVLPYLPPGHSGRVSSSVPPLYLDGFCADPFEVGERTFMSNSIVSLTSLLCTLLWE